MNKIIIILFILITNCSLDTKSGIWTEDREIIVNDNIKEIFKDKEILKKEFNQKLEIYLESKLLVNSDLIDNSNNSGRVNFNDIKNKSKFKFSKIQNFEQFEPEPIFHQSNLIFFDGRGSIFKFDEKNDLIWRKNYYSKREKKNNPILNFSSNSKTLIVVDNLAKLYALELSTGKLLWTKENLNPIYSQVKVLKDKFFVIDFNNILRCFSIKNGEEIWSFKAEDTFLKSNKRNSMIIVKDFVYFINSLGDVTSVSANNGRLSWQTPTQNSSIYESAFSLQNSDLVSNKESLYVSNNRNQFFSFNLKNGFINWKQDVNTSLKPIVINELIFTISEEGFLIILDVKNGNLVRVTDIFDVFKKKKREKIKPIGFVIGSKKIFLTTSHGRLLVIDLKSGKTESIIKIDNKKISKPFISNKIMFISKENSIIKLD